MQHGVRSGAGSTVMCGSRGRRSESPLGGLDSAIWRRIFLTSRPTYASPSAPCPMRASFDSTPRGCSRPIGSRGSDLTLSMPKPLAARPPVTDSVESGASLSLELGPRRGLGRLGHHCRARPGQTPSQPGARVFSVSSILNAEDSESPERMSSRQEDLLQSIDKKKKIETMQKQQPNSLIGDVTHQYIRTDFFLEK